MSLRRLRGRLDSLQADAHGTMAFIRDLLRDLLDDIKDGVAIKLMPMKGFSSFANKLMWSLVKFFGAYLMYKIPLLGGKGPQPEIDLTWMERSEIPLAVTIDVEFDVQPEEGKTLMLMDGPLQGHSYRVRGGDERRVHLEGGHWYIWNGHDMVYLEPESPENN